MFVRDLVDEMFAFNNEHLHELKYTYIELYDNGSGKIIGVDYEGVKRWVTGFSNLDELKEFHSKLPTSLDRI